MMHMGNVLGAVILTQRFYCFLFAVIFTIYSAYPINMTPNKMLDRYANFKSMNHWSPRETYEWLNYLGPWSAKIAPISLSLELSKPLVFFC